jgi:cytochrome b
MPTHSPPGTRTAVWDLPLRIWHWAFALCIGGSLYTGLSGDIALIERHQQLGYCMVGLLLFRMAWGMWGGRYGRFREYRFSPGKVVAHFRKGEPSTTAHTAPGAAIAIVFMLLAVVQASTGLFATDDIFTEGPLTRYVEDATASNMTWIHHRVFWLILVAIAVHLTAHVVYALRGDSMPLAMFTGRKAVKLEPTQSRLLAGKLTAAAAAGLVWTFLAYV